MIRLTPVEKTFVWLGLVYTRHKGWLRPLVVGVVRLRALIENAENQVARSSIGGKSLEAYN